MLSRQAKERAVAQDLAELFWLVVAGAVSVRARGRVASPPARMICCVVVVQYLADIRRSMAIHARPTAERRCEHAHHLTRRRPPREPGGVISGVLVLPMWSKGARVIREMRQSSFARTKSQSLTSLPGGSGPYVAR